MANTTATTRFVWNEVIEADKTEVRAPHIIELREACDDLDQRCDDHMGKGGLDKHPAATEESGGFVTPEEKKMLNEMRSGEDTEHTFKAGMVMEWLGDVNDPPAGWAVLDGKDGRPDARGRYSIGAGDALLAGALGGALDVPVPLPRHNHSAGGGGSLFVDVPGMDYRYGSIPRVDPKAPTTRYSLKAGGAPRSYSSGSGSYSSQSSSVGMGFRLEDVHIWSAPIQGGGEVYAGTEGATIRLLPPYIALVKIVKLPKATKV